MKQVNFDQCGHEFITNKTLQDRYGWHGKVVGILPNSTSQISYEGCKALCGIGNDYYPWSLSSSTITTWVLPVVGMLLQAPFESNAFLHTLLAIARWVGSPMASMSNILWNIRVSAKCALMVDLATRYGRPIAGPESDFSSIRDSFYILMTMNQFMMKRNQAMVKETEGLLRIVLFSKDLRLLPKVGKQQSLNERRQKLAKRLRERRKRGVVPVYISTMWFLFSLAISIESAFGELGQNATAHDLALGLLMAWLPVLILCSIVDRNPVSADEIRKKLNKLIQNVCEALQDDNIREEFIATFEGHEQADRLEAWVRRIGEQSKRMGDSDFFERFAGQGRIRWHYGAAHPILSDIEETYIAAHGRGWLDDEKDARLHLVLGGADKGLVWFDLRELWQIASAVLVVGGTCFGAFILSFFTPTIGLGCRSGGYVIFCSMAFSLLVLEFLVWWVTSPVLPKQPTWVSRCIKSLRRQRYLVWIEENSRRVLLRTKSRMSSFGHKTQNIFIRGALYVLTVLHVGNLPREDQLRSNLDCHKSWSFQKWSETLVFRPLEIVNTGWLLYMVLGQTFGAFRNCGCVTSVWGGAGGYLDFNQNDSTNTPWVKWYWSAGTAIGSGTMSFGMIYIVIEWCLQSHLSTEDYEAAKRGLQRTRRYRLLTYPFRYAARRFINLVLFLSTPFRGLLGLGRTPKQTLYWTKNPPVSVKHHMYHPFGSVSTDGGAPQLGVTPMIQLQDFDSPVKHAHHHSLSSDADIDTTYVGSSWRLGGYGGRTRAESDASASAPLIPNPGPVLARDWASAVSLSLHTVATNASQTPIRTSSESMLNPTATREEEGRAPPSGHLSVRPVYVRQETDRDISEDASGERDPGLGIGFGGRTSSV